MRSKPEYSETLGLSFDHFYGLRLGLNEIETQKNPVLVSISKLRLKKSQSRLGLEVETKRISG